jgi:rhodanese-related sulfurtransferase
VTVSDPRVPSIDVLEADRRLREDSARPILLDVREVIEFAAVRAPGAVLTPMSSLADHIGDIPTDRPILVICKAGGRSMVVATHLTGFGRTDITNVAGGMDAWEAAGLPIRRGAPTDDEGRLS